MHPQTTLARTTTQMGADPQKGKGAREKETGEGQRESRETTGD
jgi:hypothetical protein